MIAQPALANQNRSGQQGQRTSMSQQKGATAQVKVTRATNYLGSDVIASDGRKVGDIVDFAFDATSRPHLTHVLVMTGGFLDLGGEVRAVPAAAITTQNDQARLQIGSNEYFDVPVLPQNRERFLSDASNRQSLNQRFNVSASNRTAAANAGNESLSPTGRNTSASTSANAGRTQGSGMSANQSQAGVSDGELILFSELRNANTYSPDGDRLGYVADAWVSLDSNSAPYIEITPTYSPFRSSIDRRFAIPLARFQQESDLGGYNFNVTADELAKAEPANETQGVKILQDGTIADAVLRVTVAQR